MQQKTKMKSTIRYSLLIRMKNYNKHNMCPYVLKFKYVCYTVHNILCNQLVIIVVIAGKWLTNH